MSEPKIVDVLEHWLQGRINLSVTGLVSRLETQEKAMQEQCDLNITLLDRIKKLEDGERPNDERLYMEVNSYLKDGGGQTLVDGLIAAAINDDVTLDRRMQQTCSTYWDEWLNNNSLVDHLDSRDVWSLVEDDVETAINDSSAIDSAVTTWCDDNLDEKVKDCVGNLSFEVSLS